MAHNATVQGTLEGATDTQHWQRHAPPPMTQASCRLLRTTKRASTLQHLHLQVAGYRCSCESGASYSTLTVQVHTYTTRNRQAASTCPRKEGITRSHWPTYCCGTHRCSNRLHATWKQTSTQQFTLKSLLSADKIVYTHTPRRDVSTGGPGRCQPPAALHNMCASSHTLFATTLSKQHQQLLKSASTAGMVTITSIRLLRRHAACCRPSSSVCQVITQQQHSTRMQPVDCRCLLQQAQDIGIKTWQEGIPISRSSAKHGQVMAAIQLVAAAATACPAPNSAVRPTHTVKRSCIQSLRVNQSKQPALPSRISSCQQRR